MRELTDELLTGSFGGLPGEADGGKAAYVALVAGGRSGFDAVSITPRPPPPALRR